MPQAESDETLAWLGGIIVWVGVPLVAWGALLWAAILAARAVA